MQHNIMLNIQLSVNCSMKLEVYIGFDRRQPVAAQVLTYSIYLKASKPVSITPLVIEQLPMKRVGLTSFTYSRFLVPWICDYKPGYVIFLDSDILCLGDIYELVELAYQQAAPVSIIPHEKKFERPSVMVFNPSACRQLTPEYIENMKNT